MIFSFINLKIPTKFHFYYMPVYQLFKLELLKFNPIEIPIFKILPYPYT